MYEKLLRNVFYPAYETLLRRRKTLEYLEGYEANQWKSTAQLRAIQWDKLLNLLRYCEEQVPFYQERWRAQDIHWQDIKTLGDFNQLPTLTKKDIRENREKMIAIPEQGRTLTKATGGSTGEPLRFDYTRESYERRMAVALRGYRWAGADLGTKSLYLWGVDLNDGDFTAKLKNHLYHKVLRHKILNCFALMGTNAANYVAEINQHKPKVIISYATPLYTLAQQICDLGLDCWSPEAAITAAEPLFSYQRQLIERAFGCSVFDTYGCREFMLIGAECPQHSGLHLNIDHLVIDVLDDEDHLCSAGESGDIAVTDLHNYGMPFIRYKLGDRGTLTDAPCSCGRGLPLLESVDGRRLDLIRTPDGRMLPGEFFPHLLKDVEGIQRFQVVQDRLDHLTISIVKDPLSERILLDFAKRKIREALGEETTVDYELVEEIPLTRSGKLRVTVSKIR